MKHHLNEPRWINKTPPVYALCKNCLGIYGDGQLDRKMDCAECQGTGRLPIPWPEIMECWKT